MNKLMEYINIDAINSFWSYILLRYMDNNNMSMAAVARNAGVNVKTIRALVDKKNKKHRIDIATDVLQGMQMSLDSFYYGLMMYGFVNAHPEEPEYKEVFDIFIDSRECERRAMLILWEKERKDNGG